MRGALIGTSNFEGGGLQRRGEYFGASLRGLQ
jgi:hypothetical protein